MTIELTKEDKAAIVNQHLKDLAYTEYNLELNLIEINASTTPNKDNIDTVNNQLKDVQAKKAALQTELDSLN